MYEYIRKDVEDFKVQQWSAWVDLVSTHSEAQLKKPLLV